MDLRNYIVVTAAYWGFTLTDGALRMLVLLHFHTLGYSPLQIAWLFLFYELFGVITNLIGGWIGAVLGLRATLFGGLALQVLALLALAALQPAWVLWVSVAYVMAAQALSGIAKDLTKLSSKSAIRLVVPEGADSLLFRWVALLTGSKNALKGVGFFLGGLLLAAVGFAPALVAMAGALAVLLVGAALALPRGMGRSKAKARFSALLSKSRAINLLSAARFFLFGSRDVWFVVGLPVFLYDRLGWGFAQVGGFLALWVIGYGAVQAAAPAMLRAAGISSRALATQLCTAVLAAVPAGIALALGAGWNPAAVLVGGLALFAWVFALDSSLHSYLILAFTERDEVSLNVGFYYMANAAGRLAGTVLSGWLYGVGGLAGCLWAAVAFVLAAAALSLLLPPEPSRTGQPTGVAPAGES